MTYRSLIAAMFLACCIVAVGAPAPAHAQTALPWALRNHYSFPAGNALIRYAEADAGWCLETTDPVSGQTATLIDHIGFEILLQDGSVLTAAALGTAACTREDVADPQGETTQYTVRFPETGGLAVEHRITRFKDRLFLVMDISVRNTGTSPVGIAAISPVVVGALSKADFGSDGEVVVRSMTARGGSAVVQSNGGGGLTLFHAPSKKVLLALGLLPEGRAQTLSSFQHAGSTWQGRITSSYAPYMTLDPGETLHSDRLWISHGIPESHQVDLQYAWMYSLIARATPAAPEALAWVSVDDSGSLADLEAAARAWRPSGIRHALVPARWEGRPGSLQGATPRYPRDMRAAAAALRQAGCVPGITVDPLLAEDGQPEWAVRADDGYIWLDLSHEGARAAAVARLSKFLADGFDFVAVEQSLIPDAVLNRFGQSRAEADRLAFETVVAAAGTRPVFPTAEAILPLDRDAWREAAAAASRLAVYRVASGALRLAADRDARLDEDTAAALRLWPGAIEILGEGSGAVRDALGRALAQGRLSSYPLDATHRAPALWQSDFLDEKLGFLGGAVISFPGCPAWTPELANLGNDRILWNPSTGELIAGTGTALPASDRITTYGVAPLNGHPAVMGASAGWMLHLDRLEGVTWDPDAGVLRGVLRGPFERGAVGHVLVPETWSYAEGKVGGEKLRVQEPGQRISFALGGDATAFELRFERRM